MSCSLRARFPLIRLICAHSIPLYMRMEHLGTWMSALTVPAVQGGCTVRDKCAPLSPAPTLQRLLDSAVLNVRQTDCVHVLLLQSYCIHCLVIHHHCQTAYMFCLPSQNSDLPRAPLSTYRRAGWVKCSAQWRRTPCPASLVPRPPSSSSSYLGTRLARAPVEVVS